MRIAVLALLALGAAGSAEENLATLRAIDKLSKEIQGKSIDEALTQKLADDMASFYAPKLNCAASPSSPIGFELSGVALADCSAAWAKTYRGINYLSMTNEFAVEPGSGGNTILAWNTQEYKADVDGPPVSAILAAKYKFDDEGRIADIHEEFDTSRVLKGASAAGERNLASLKATYKIAKELQGKSLDAALMQRLTQDLAGFYSPKVDCAVSTGFVSGFELKGVPFPDCGAAWAQSFGHLRMLGWSFEPAVVPGSGGKTLLNWQRFSYDGPGTGFGIDAYRYEFDDEGLIVAQHEVMGISTPTENYASAGVPLPSVGAPQTVVSFAAGCLTTATAFATLLVIARRRQDPSSGYQGLAA